MPKRLALPALAAALLSMPPAASAEDPLLREMVETVGTFTYYSAGVPALVIGAYRDGETAVFGIGEIRDGGGTAPDGDTLMRIGSLTKTFTGGTLAALVIDGTVGFTDPLADHLGWDVTLPARDGQPMRLLHLATHTSGLPREAAGTSEDKTAEENRAAMVAALAADPLLFTPGTGALYSNFGFNLLGSALSAATGKPLEDLFRERIFEPAGMTDTTFAPAEADADRIMQGHFIDGSPMEDTVTPDGIHGAGGLYSTANDILRYIAFHLDRASGEHAEFRLLSQAPYVPRDTLRVVSGLDLEGRMDFMSLGWVVMVREGDRPTILQKSGGHGGIFSYMAFAPGHDVGGFIAINEFDFTAGAEIGRVVNDLVTGLAGR